MTDMERNEIADLDGRTAFEAKTLTLPMMAAYIPMMTAAALSTAGRFKARIG